MFAVGPAVRTTHGRTVTDCVRFRKAIFRHNTNRVLITVMGYETCKLITSDTDLERGNAQRERWKIATTC